MKNAIVLCALLFSTHSFASDVKCLKTAIHAAALHVGDSDEEFNWTHSTEVAERSSDGRENYEFRSGIGASIIVEIESKNDECLVKKVYSGMFDLNE